MNRLTACMFGLLGVAGAVLIMALSQPAAEAHRNYCGHSYTFWTVWSYGNPIDYRERYLYADNSDFTNHYHGTVVEYRSGGKPWRVVHYHFRLCGQIPV